MTGTWNPIDATGLGHQFDGVAVLENITLSIAVAECVALTGTNGSGKTTLLRCLAGALIPTSGTVSWYGQNSKSLAVRRQIGFVTHRPQVYPQLSVLENLIFAARMTGVPAPKQRVWRALEGSGLRPFADARPTRLSKGMLQRLAILRALVHEPAMVLLDEPFTGLDQEGRDWLNALLETFRHEGRAICVTTHDLRAMKPRPQRVLRLWSGGLEELGRGSCRDALRSAA